MPNTFARAVTVAFKVLGVILVLVGAARLAYEAIFILTVNWNADVSLPQALVVVFHPVSLWNSGGGVLLTGMAIVFLGVAVDLLRQITDRLSRLAETSEIRGGAP